MFKKIAFCLVSDYMATGKSSASSKVDLKDRQAQLKDILLEEARAQSMKNPFIGLPLNHYDEIFDNCFLGDM